MKKIITTVLIIFGCTFFAYAELQINSIGGRLGGTPIQYNAANGGTLSIGSGANLAGGFGSGSGSGVLGIINFLQTILGRLVPLTVSLAMLAFFWYLVLFIWKGNEEPAKRQEGIKGMGYALLAMFVMVSLWGIMAFLSSMLGIGIGGSLPPIQMPRAK